MNNSEQQRAMDRVLRALAQRAHSEQELVDKLTRAGFDEQVIAKTMAKLQEYHLTDDGTFAVQWASARTKRGMGPWRIAQELRHKGVDSETTDEAIAQIDEDAAMEAATALARKHLRRGDERAKQRAYEALVRRGYGYSTARHALALAQASLDEEDAFSP